MQIEVNFLYQIVSFHRFKRENEISANAQALWLELVGLFNTRRFPQSLPVSTTHLCQVLCLAKDTVLRARRELEESGLISVERAAKGRAASVVTMHYFIKDSAQDCGKPVDKPENTVDNKADSVDNTPACVANMDERSDAKGCGANSDANCDMKKTSAANMDANCAAKKTSVANMDAKCDAYTNLNGADVNRDSDTVTQNVCITDDDEDAAGDMRAYARAHEGMRRHFGRDATPGEAKKIAREARRDEDFDYTELIDLALEIAAKYGARSPALYCAEVFSQWRGEYLMTEEDVRLFIELSCQYKSEDRDYSEEAFRGLQQLKSDCMRRWRDKVFGRWRNRR